MMQEFYYDNLSSTFAGFQKRAENVLLRMREVSLQYHLKLTFSRFQNFGFQFRTFEGSNLK